MIRLFEEETTNEIAIVTINKIDPYQELRDYAVALGNEWGVGKAEKDNGVVIVISRELRNMFMATGIGTEVILTDSICQIIVDDFFIPSFKEGDYYQGIVDGLNEVMRQWPSN